MKKLKLLLTIVLCTLMIGHVNAMTLKPTGDSTGKLGEEKTVYITLERTSSEPEVSAIEGIIEYDTDVLEFVKSELLVEKWTELSADFDDGGTFSYANLTQDNLINSTSKNIIKLVFKIKADAETGETTISLSEGETGIVDGESEAIEDVTYREYTLEVISEEGNNNTGNQTPNTTGTVTPTNNPDKGVTTPPTGESTITITILATIILAILTFALVPNYKKDE